MPKAKPRQHFSTDKDYDEYMYFWNLFAKNNKHIWKGTCYKCSKSFETKQWIIECPKCQNNLRKINSSMENQKQYLSGYWDPIEINKRVSKEWKK